MYTFRVSFFVVSILIFSYGVCNAQTTLFAAAAETCDDPAPATNSILYTVDPETGNSTAVGSIGFEGVTGLAFLGDGSLVASAQADVDESDRTAILIEINQITGQGTFIGKIGDNDSMDNCGRAPDLTYDPATDTLYAIGRRCVEFANNESVLMRINQITGLGNIIGTTGVVGSSGNGLAIRADGTLFWAINVTTLPSSLFTINPATGLATEVTTFNQEFPSLSAFTFHPVTGELFASNLNDPLFPFPGAGLQIVNTTNGTLTTIGALPNCTDALVFSPPPTPTPTPSPTPTNGAFQPGDANGDGVINILDVTVILNDILEISAAPGNGDCNVDGQVNILDVTCVLNIILEL